MKYTWKLFFKTWHIIVWLLILSEASKRSSMLTTFCITLNLPIYLSIRQADSLAICLSLSLILCPCVYLPVCLSVHLSISLSDYSAICLSVCLSFSPSLSLSLSLFLSLTHYFSRKLQDIAAERSLNLKQTWRKYFCGCDTQSKNSVHCLEWKYCNIKR